MHNCDGFRLKVFDDNDLKGTAMYVDHSISNLKDVHHPSRNSWNDEIKSAHWERIPKPYIDPRFELNVPLRVRESYGAAWVWYYSAPWVEQNSGDGARTPMPTSKAPGTTGPRPRSR